MNNFMICILFGLALYLNKALIKNNVPPKQKRKPALIPSGDQMSSGEGFFNPRVNSIFKPLADLYFATSINWAIFISIPIS